MGEWSEYFEDFPEENPANQIREPDLGPMSIAFPHLYASQLTKVERIVENAKHEELLQKEEIKRKQKEKLIKALKQGPIFSVEDCPLCYAQAMHIYKSDNLSIYCECLECHSSGLGDDISLIFESILDK